jgi:4-amino-4-deoxy-L-arabinose transferase-like glycosyltransferase
MLIRVVQPLAVAVLIWTMLVVVGLTTRPPLPVDETRYLAVAWEMWRGGDYLVPRLNGVAYHHKPPLLFWLMNLGWLCLGVSETWARLVAPLFALGSLLLTTYLARLLFPSTLRVAGIAPLATIGTAIMTLFASLTFFDTMLAFFTLLGMIGIVLASRGRPVFGWILTGLAFGLGILSKGPVQILDLAPVALLAPLWAEERPASWLRWYGGLLLALLGGAAIALAWAVPAALAGGPDFAYMLFVGQSTQRVVETMWHERPWWWYVPAAFVLAFPWLLWPGFWRSLFVRRVWSEPGVRFCLSMLVPVFVVFSAISGKQPHYLLPMMPVLALLLARFAVAGEFHDGRWWRLLPLAVLLATAVAMLALASDPARLGRFDDVLAATRASGPVGLVVCAVLVVLMLVLILDRARTPVVRIGTLAVAVAATLIAVHFAVFANLRPRYDGANVAAVLARAEAEGKQIAHIGDYHGQYHFAGRLARPIVPIFEHDAVEWARANQQALIVDYRETEPASPPALPLYSQPWRGRFIFIWPAAAVAEFGEVLLLDRPR